MPWVPIPPRPDVVIHDLAGTTVGDRSEIPALDAVTDLNAVWPQVEV
jgi:hypothetical protein